MIQKITVRRGNDPIQEKEGVLIVSTTEKRERNKANIDIIRQLSKHYSIPQSSIRLISGATSSKKVVEILEVNESKSK